MTYWYNKSDPGGRSFLIFGDDSGCLHIFNFLQPNKGLFESPTKKQEGHLKINMKVSQSSVFLPTIYLNLICLTCRYDPAVFYVSSTMNLFRMKGCVNGASLLQWCWGGGGSPSALLLKIDFAFL